MKKHKKILSFAILITTCIAISIYTFFCLIFTNCQRDKNQKQDLDYKYLVKDVSGKINIFKQGQNKPIKIIPKAVRFLPEYDQKMLKDGIYIKTKEQLNNVLEDYED